jgi:hypothetical protein
MRRLAVLALAVLALAACSGEQGARAQQLLTRAEAAQARLTSATYEARMSVSMDGHRFSLVMNGGAYLKGRRAGDQILSMRADGIPGAGSFDVRMLIRGRQASINMNGRRYSMPLSASTKQQFDWSSTMVDLAGYVKEVKVREGRVVNGERGATITGVINTAGLLEAVTKLEAFKQVAGPAAPDAAFDELADHLSDVRVALFVAQRTGLIRSAVLNLGIEADGNNAELQLTYRLASTNRAIAGL